MLVFGSVKAEIVTVLMLKHTLCTSKVQSSQYHNTKWGPMNEPTCDFIAQHDSALT